MAVLDLVLYPDDRLRAPCRPVDSFDEALQTLIDDMIDTMYDAPGIGLAAPQVGHNLQITVIDTRDREKPDPDNPGLLVLINPRVVEQGDDTITWEEGCLSIPGVFDDVTRPNRVVVEALDRHGEIFTVEGEELMAVCLQHEIDHLNGVLFLDYLSRLKMRMAMKTYKRTKAGYLADLKKKREASKEPT